jgi:hypothetical protein
MLSQERNKHHSAKKFTGEVISSSRQADKLLEVPRTHRGYEPSSFSKLVDKGRRN